MVRLSNQKTKIKNMSKIKTIFNCSNCDAQFPKWVGRCEQCGKWGTITEQILNSVSSVSGGRSNIAGAGQPLSTAGAKKPRNLSEIKLNNSQRIKTRIECLDLVFGGGLIPGSLLLLGGDPGVGKSTLALHIAHKIPQTLYISGEESEAQIKTNAQRLGVENILLLHETNCETICATIAQERPRVAVVDSIQTIASAEVEGSVGSVSQIRACAAKILATAKQSNTCVLIIGHVTKDGAVAGPKTLEHLVDTVLYFEGESSSDLRMLRTTKNRFGSTDEVAIFEMNEHGLMPNKNPITAFLQQNRTQVPGSVITVLMDGKQPLLVEVQALTTKTIFGYPQRRASGFDLNRLQVLIAVLTQRAGLPLAQYDVHINVVGGLKANEPAADLAIVCAIVSSLKNVVLKDYAIFGEIGLGGEIRPVRSMDKRINTAHKLGFTNILVSQNNSKLETKQVRTIHDLNNIIK